MHSMRRRHSGARTGSMRRCARGSPKRAAWSQPYYLKANAGGPGDHVSNCGYMVSEAARGRGVARLMCEHSQQVARERGFLAMQFNSVVSTNEVAVALWQKLGFEIVGRLPRAYRHARLGFVDSLVMFKWLGDTAAAEA